MNLTPFLWSLMLFAMLCNFDKHFAYCLQLVKAIILTILPLISSYTDLYLMRTTGYYVYPNLTLSLKCSVIILCYNKRNKWIDIAKGL